MVTFCLEPVNAAQRFLVQVLDPFVVSTTFRKGGVDINIGCIMGVGDLRSVTGACDGILGAWCRCGFSLVSIGWQVRQERVFQTFAVIAVVELKGVVVEVCHPARGLGAGWLSISANKAQ
jgi:hypothetical protein